MLRKNHLATSLIGCDQVRYLASLVLGFLFLCLPLSSTGQAEFERTYGGNREEGGRDVRQTTDGGYIVTGSTSSFGAGRYDVYLIKTDSLGDTLWTRTYGDTALEYGYSARQTSDGGYIVTGLTESFGAGWADVYLVKTDANGDTLWTRTYGGSGYECGYAVEQTLDGGYLIVGETGARGADVYLVRTDSIGDTLWTRVYGEFQDDKCFSIDQAWGGGYILAGFRRVSTDDFYLIRVDTLGDTLWTRTYYRPGVDKGNCGRLAWDGGYVIAGEAYGEFFLVRTDPRGDTLWTRRYGGGLCYSVDQTYLGGYILAGFSKSFSPPYPRVYLVETDAWGQKIFEWVFGFRFLYAYGRSVQQTLDGGYIVAGHAEVLDSTRTQVYLIKVPGPGIDFHNCGVIALDSPGDTVFTDSSYSVRATFRNFGNVPEVFTATARIDGYVDSVVVLDLAPRSSGQVTFKNWQVPSNDSLTYSMTVYIDVFNDIYPHNDTMSKAIFAYNPTGVEEGPNDRSRVTDFRLWQNKPNPFSRSTTIRYSLPAACPVNLSVYDVSGSLVETLVDGWREEGIHSMTWDGSDRAGGIYFCRFQGDSFVDTKKVILLR